MHTPHDPLPFLQKHPRYNAARSCYVHPRASPRSAPGPGSGAILTLFLRLSVLTPLHLPHLFGLEARGLSLPELERVPRHVCLARARAQGPPRVHPYPPSPLWEDQHPRSLLRLSFGPAPRVFRRLARTMCMEPHPRVSTLISLSGLSLHFSFYTPSPLSLPSSTPLPHRK